MKTLGVWWVLAGGLLGGCFGGAGGGDGDADEGARADLSGEACGYAEAVAEIAVTNIDRVDLLFVIDDSSSMGEEQAALQQQFPHLVRMLTTGDRDGDGMPDFSPTQDLHLGVVSTDLGVGGIGGVPDCDGLGDDGVLRHGVNTAIAGCPADALPPFIAYLEGPSDADQAARDFACSAGLGTGGCGFEQPLEAALKALWPATDRGGPGAVDPAGMAREPNRVAFLGDPGTGAGTTGHGDGANAGFLRNDPATGLSVIAVVVVTDEDDCSSADTSHFVPADQLEPGDRLAAQAMNLRCFFNQANLFDLDRYVNGLQTLRPDNPQLVLFAAIAGVPPDLVDEPTRSGVDFTSAAERAAYYANILNDPRMQQVPNPDASPDDDSGLTPSCAIDTNADGSSDSRAFPPRRLVELASRFGENGFVQSICQVDFSDALEGIVGIVSRQLGAVCLPRSLPLDENGLVQCDVTWQLPLPGQAPASTPIACEELPEFLGQPAGRERFNERGNRICTVKQLPSPPPGEAPADQGWFYQVFDPGDPAAECPPSTPQRVAFTAAAMPPSGVIVRLECADLTRARDSDESLSCAAAAGPAVASRVGDRCSPGEVPEGGFDDRETTLWTGTEACGKGPCVVDHLRGDPRASCDPSRGCDPADPDCPQSAGCAEADEVKQRIYCTCRCDAPNDPGAATCECPDGFTCQPLLQISPDGVSGSYCVREGLR